MADEASLSLNPQLSPMEKLPSHSSAAEDIGLPSISDLFSHGKRPLSSYPSEGYGLGNPLISPIITTNLSHNHGSFPAYHERDTGYSNSLQRFIENDERSALVPPGSTLGAGHPTRPSFSEPAYSHKSAGYPPSFTSGDTDYDAYAFPHTPSTALSSWTNSPDHKSREFPDHHRLPPYVRASSDITSLSPTSCDQGWRTRSSISASSEASQSEHRLESVDPRKLSAEEESYDSEDADCDAEDDYDPPPQIYLNDRHPMHPPLRRPSPFGSTIHEGYYNDVPPAPMEVQPARGSQYSAPTGPSTRHGRSYSAASLSVPGGVSPYNRTPGLHRSASDGSSHRRRGSNKIRKQNRSSANKSYKQPTGTDPRRKNSQPRQFYCTFHFAQCNQTFASKNEWKRHVYSQHLQLQAWACDFPDCTDRRAIFNRKDLFGQHLKRMHAPPQSHAKQQQQSKDHTQFINVEIPKIQDRCKQDRRTPPENSRCGFCGDTFEDWEYRMEHVGKHYETAGPSGIGVEPDKWHMDEGLVQWALHHEIVRVGEGGRYELVSAGKDAVVGTARSR